MSSIYSFFQNSGDQISKKIFSLFFHRSTSRKDRAKIHDYSQYESGSDYIFELINEGSKGYLTAQNKGVQVGDRVILKHLDNRNYYQVESIDYYSNPPDMYIALLKRLATKLD